MVLRAWCRSGFSGALSPWHGLAIIPQGSGSAVPVGSVPQGVQGCREEALEAPWTDEHLHGAPEGPLGAWFEEGTGIVPLGQVVLHSLSSQFMLLQTMTQVL